MQNKIPYGRQQVTQDDIDSVVAVLRSEWLTQGTVVPEFEKALARYCDTQHALTTNSATSALHIACLALDVKPGDRVWTSPNTFVASANCAVYCGAQVDFVDIDPLTYNMSVDRLVEKLVTAEISGSLPKVLIPVHFAGQSCDMQAIHALGLQYGFKIIEDASHAIGGKYRCTSSVVVGDKSGSLSESSGMEPVGNGRFSDITIFSFHPVKIITTGEGGVALTNDSKLAERMLRLRSHGTTNDPELMKARPVDEIWNYQQIDLGFNYRMTELQAALGLSQLSRIDTYVGRRHQIAQYYDYVFANLPVVTPWQHPDSWSSYHLYPIRVRQEECGKTQKQVYDAFLAAGINVNLHYIPVYLQPYYSEMGFKRGYCPEAERYYQETLSLPIFPTLTDADQETVIRILFEVIGK